METPEEWWDVVPKQGSPPCPSRLNAPHPHMTHVSPHQPLSFPPFHFSSNLLLDSLSLSPKVSNQQRPGYFTLWLELSLTCRRPSFPARSRQAPTPSNETARKN